LDWIDEYKKIGLVPIEGRIHESVPDHQRRLMRQQQVSEHNKEAIGSALKEGIGCMQMETKKKNRTC